MTPDEQFEIYERVCKEKFDHIILKQDKVLELLQGTVERPGLVEDVMGLKKVYKTIVAIVSGMAVVVFGSAINWIFRQFGGS